MPKFDVTFRIISTRSIEVEAKDTDEVAEVIESKMGLDGTDLIEESLELMLDYVIESTRDTKTYKNKTIPYITKISDSRQNYLAMMATVKDMQRRLAKMDTFGGSLDEILKRLSIAIKQSDK